MNPYEQVHIDRKLGYRRHEWTTDEERLVLEGFISDEDLAKAMRVSVNAIRIRRIELRNGRYNR